MAGAEQHRLPRLGLSTGGGVECCIAAQSPAGILADAARNLHGAARMDAAKSDSSPQRRC